MEAILFWEILPCTSNIKPAAHLRKELSKLPCEASPGNQLSCFLKCAVEFSREFHLARRNLKHQTRQIFSSRPREAKNSRKLNRTRDETAELFASRGSLLSSFLKCAADFMYARFEVFRSFCAFLGFSYPTNYG